MAIIDSRLLDCDSPQEVTENFNRALAIIDALDVRVTKLEGGVVYLVEYDSKGGSAVPDESVKGGNKATEPTDPTKTGNAFVEWDLDGEAFDFDTPITDNITLDAVWTPNEYTLSYNYHGADGGNEDVSKTVTFGEAYGTLPAPTKTGSTFSGWFTAAEGGDAVTDETVAGAGDTTIHAQWT